METIKKRISDLELASLPLKGNEMFEVSQGGVSMRILADNFYADGWFSRLQKSPDEFVAADSVRADQADAALFADDAAAVSGLSFEDGKGLDRFEEVRIAAKGAWVIPSGTFLVYAWSTASIASLALEADDARVPGTWGLRAPFPAGLIVSDGVSQRIRNTSTAEIGITCRVLIHKS
jgi:hypothetical protein